MFDIVETYSTPIRLQLLVSKQMFKVDWQNVPKASKESSEITAKYQLATGYPDVKETKKRL